MHVRTDVYMHVPMHVYIYIYNVERCRVYQYILHFLLRIYTHMCGQRNMLLLLDVDNLELPAV